ncbi:MAG: T9SS type A sorting domain-containing protein [Saprospiraceae bacterium]|nr:T9SS type A sorting domain-containing protein [Saprospiraceae bacterium]
MKKTTFIYLSLLAFFSRLTCPIFAQQEFLDPGFGVAGKQTLILPAYDKIGDMLVQPDGKILLAGESLQGEEPRRLTIARYLPDGSPDPTFGVNGKNGSSYGDSESIALQSDGKIVVLQPSDVLTRFTSDGQLDPVFPNPVNLDNSFYFRDLAIDADENFVLAGSGLSNNEGFRLQRYFSDGTKDWNFGDNGAVKLDFGPGYERATSVAVLPDGKIAVCGYYSPNSGPLGLILVRLNQDGSLDDSFNSEGFILVDGDTTSFNNPVLMPQSDGKLVVGTTDYGTVILFRFNTNGALDDTFGAGGVAKIVLYHEAVCFAQAPDGSIYAGCMPDRVFKCTASGALDPNFGDAGELYVTSAPQFIAVKSNSGFITANSISGDFSTMSYLTDGSPDPVFNGGAPVVDNIGQSGGSFHKLLIQPDGKIIAGGENLASQRVMARLGINGFPDESFKFPINDDLENGVAQISGMALQADGKIIVGGQQNFSGWPEGSLYRLLPDGTPDSIFYGPQSPVVALALQPDGKILTAEVGTTTPTNWWSGIRRFQVNGTADQTFGLSGYWSTKPYWAYLLALQADGKILTAGWKNFSDPSAILRYNSNGLPDTTFGINGVLEAPGTEFIIPFPDGKFLLAGPQIDGFEISRYLENGSPDTGFGTAGKKWIPLGNGAGISAMSVQVDGKILLAGGAGGPNQGDFLLGRLLPDGNPDSSAGVGGFVTTNFGVDSYSQAFGLAVQADGKILLSGTSFMSAYTAFALVRYRANLTVEALEIYPARAPEITFQPNPAHDFLQIQIKEKGIWDIDIFSAQGETVFEQSVSGTRELSLSNWPPGIYTLRAVSGGRVFVGKVVKQ